MTTTRRLRSPAACVCLGLFAAQLAGCCLFSPYETPGDIDTWLDPSPPRLTLAEKAARYQAVIEARHQLAGGIIRYHTQLGPDGPLPGAGNLADGCFHLGIYFGAQALRFATTGEPAAREQLLLSLGAMELYADVSGKRGLLPRYVATEKPEDDRWLRSSTRPGYFWRSDVSKDQYAGYVHGLGVALAVVGDAGIRRRVSALAAAVADHLIENDLRIIDWDGERTTHGDLRGRQFGIPFGVDALICLAIAKAAAYGTGDPKYVAFYGRLVREGYPRLSRWARLVLLQTKRVNCHMAYLALLPLLALETEPAIRLELQATERVLWETVKDEYNGFFAFVHASVGDCLDDPGAGRASSSAANAGRQALRLFPDDKIAWPVDLTRSGFDFPRSLFSDKHCRPKSTIAVPTYLRARASSMWVSDPYRLVNDLNDRGENEYAGVDYLQAYWLGRYYGFVGAKD